MRRDEVLSQVRARLRGHTSTADEVAIVALLRGLADADLDAALGELDLPELLDSLEARLLGPDTRGALYTLVQERLPGLSVPTRAALIDALQVGRTGSADERVIDALVRGTLGEALWTLRWTLQHRPNDRDLLRLVYQDIDNPELRLALLGHFRAHPSARSGASVMSDIDDTLYRNWKDPRYPANTVYPGVRTFLRLIRGAEGLLAFVTARPGDALGLVEGYTRHRLRGLDLPPHAVYTGALDAMASHHAMAQEKVENLLRHHTLFPELPLIWVGDSGQADPLVAQQARGVLPLRACFIHDVVQTPPEQRAAAAADGVLYVDTWVGAAHQAERLGLLSAAEVALVAADARAEFESLRFDAPEQRAARHAELLADLAEAGLA